jgi:hypothetical protein
MPPIGPEDETPPDGTRTRAASRSENTPTEPRPSLICPECRGNGHTLAAIERNPDGRSIAKAVMLRCEMCGATGRLTAAQLSEWHAKRQGRSKR